MVKCQETLGLKCWRAEGTGNPIGNFHASAKNKCHNKLVPHNIPEVYSKSLQGCISTLLSLLPYTEHSTEAKRVLGGTHYLWEQGRSDLARDSCNFSAKIYPLGNNKPSQQVVTFSLLLQQNDTSKTVDMARK